MQREEGRLIVRIRQESDARDTIERAKQRFTSLIEAHDLGPLHQVFLDFPAKDNNYIEILKSKVDFPGVIGASWDKQIFLPKDDISQEGDTPYWINSETGRLHADVTAADLQANDFPEGVTNGGRQHGTLTSNEPSRAEIAQAVAQEGDSLDNIQQQINPFAYGGVVPYTGSTGTPVYEGVINNGSYGPKLAYLGNTGTVFESYEVDYLIPGMTFYIWVRDSSNLNSKWCFSTTPDGTHNGGVEYTTGVQRSGTPGTGNAFIAVDITANMPLELYIYEENTPGLGIKGGPNGTYPTSATRSMKITLFNKWYLQRRNTHFIWSTCTH